MKPNRALTRQAIIKAKLELLEQAADEFVAKRDAASVEVVLEACRDLVKAKRSATKMRIEAA